MGIHWYHPKRWILGLLLRYLQGQKRYALFSLSSTEKENNEKMDTHYLSRLDKSRFQSKL